MGLDEIVSFTVPQNTRSTRVMEKIGLVRDPAADFDHPRVDPVAYPQLVRHVLYRLTREEWIAQRDRSTDRPPSRYPGSSPIPDIDGIANASLDRMSEQQRHMVGRAAAATAGDTEEDAGTSVEAKERAEADASYEDPAVELPGEDDYIAPGANVGEANRSQGLDHVGGYGNRPIPQAPGPNQDH